MYTLYKFHFLNGISEINQLFDDILIIWPAPVCIYIKKNLTNHQTFKYLHTYHFYNLILIGRIYAEM